MQTDVKSNQPYYVLEFFMFSQGTCSLTNSENNTSLLVNFYILIF